MKTPRLASLIYNSNPFYLISACVALFGFQHAQNSFGLADDPRILAILFASYSTLMAVTAFLIVRLGRVWDDARSIMMVLLLMAFALANSFDHLCIGQLETAAMMLGGGFLFSVLISESLMWSLKMKMPWVYRGPLYIVLGIVFGYPLLFGIRDRWFADLDVRSLLVLFPIVASIGILTLIPAARLGRRSIGDTGTPWKWPLYPWSLFALLAIGICGKAYLLCMAFDPTLGRSTIFAPYFLAPVFLSMIVLWFEYCAKNDRKEIGLPMFCGGLVLLACFPWHVSSNAVNYQLSLTQDFASPFWLVTMALVLLSAIAWLRGLDKSGVGLTMMLLLSVSTHPNVTGISGYHFSVWPLFALALFQLIRSKPQVWSRCVCAAMTWALIGTLVQVRQSQFHEFTGLVSVHAVLAILLIVGVLFNDRFAKQIRVLAVLGILLTVLASAVAGSAALAPVMLCSAECAVLGVIGLISWISTRDRMFAYTTIACFVLGAFPTALLLLIEQSGQAKDSTMTMAILAAVVCFVLGVAISSLKAGLSKIVIAELNRISSEVKRRFQPIGLMAKDQTG